MRAYYQGEIDYFCAVYAIINACRHAAIGKHRFGFREGCRFYQHMMQWLFDHEHLIPVMYHGTDFELMGELLKVAKSILRKIMGCACTSSVPLPIKMFQYSEPAR